MQLVIKESQDRKSSLKKLLIYCICHGNACNKVIRSNGGVGKICSYKEEQHDQITHFPLNFLYKRRIERRCSMSPQR